MYKIVLVFALITMLSILIPMFSAIGVVLTFPSIISLGILFVVLGKGV